MLVLLTLTAAGEDTSTAVITAKGLLREALLVTVDILVSTPDGRTGLWTETVQKITIPGRPVAVSLEGSGSRLKVNFTVYPGTGGNSVLVASSESWVDSSYSSAVTSLDVSYRDEVYYYPLGRASEGAEGNPAEVRMAIIIVPYLDTLDQATRDELMSVFDSSARFDLSGEDP